MPGIGVVSNPQSGINRRRPRLAQDLAYVLGERGELHEPTGVDRLLSVAEQFKARAIDVVCISGGDGTAHKVLSALLAVYGTDPLPMVALLRGGTMNTVARSIGIPRLRPEAILGRIVERYHGRLDFQIAERNLLVVDDRYAGFMFGTGIMATFLEAYYEGGNVGPWKAATVLARGVLSALVRGPFVQRLLRPVRARATLDGRRWEPEEFLTIGAATIPDLGLGFRPFHEIDRYPDRIQALGFACPPLGIAQALPAYFLKRASGRSDILSGITSELVLESDVPLAFQLDGDFVQAGKRMVVRAGPRVRLIAG